MINYIFNVTGYDNWLQVAKKLENNDIAKQFFYLAMINVLTK